MQPPGNERNVLTWIRDRNGYERWEIDSYSRRYSKWYEATVWKQTVLYWKELDPKPDYKEGE